MKELNSYIIEKLRINKNTKFDNTDDYIKAKGDNLDELKDWVHNEWDGTSSFLIKNSIPEKDVDELVDYMYELDNNIDPGRAEYDATDFDVNFWIVNVELTKEDK